MLGYLKTFSSGHIAMIVLSIVYGYLFIKLEDTYDKKYAPYNRALFIIILIATKAIRYYFDVQLGVFRLIKLLSFHICSISTVLIIISMIRDKYPRTISSFLIVLGFPAALSVVLTTKFELRPPIILRSNLFILYHALILVGIIYVVRKTQLILHIKDYLNVIASLIVIIIISAILNLTFDLNYLYIIEPPKGTILETIHNAVNSHFLYLIIFLILALTIMSIQFLLCKYILLAIHNHGDKKEINA